MCQNRFQSTWGSAWQVGGSDTHFPQLAEGSALRLPKAWAIGVALLSPPNAIRKERMAQSTGRTASKKWITLRLTSEEKIRLEKQVTISGLSLSEFVRRQIFGGRPILAQGDLAIIGELRRQGGLLKSHFSLLRQSKATPEVMQCMEDTLRAIANAIQKLGLA